MRIFIPERLTLTAASSSSACLAVPPFQWNVPVLSFSTGKLPQTGCPSNRISSASLSSGGWKSKTTASAGLVLSVPVRETCSHLASLASLASLAYRSINPDCLLHMEFSFVHACVQISSLYNDTIYTGLTSLRAQMVKNLPTLRKTWIWSLGQEDSLEEEMATHFQYSCMENSMDRGDWRATVYGNAKSWTWLND